MHDGEQYRGGKKDSPQRHRDSEEEEERRNGCAF
jgi:hypothetical protein